MRRGLAVLLVAVVLLHHQVDCLQYTKPNILKYKGNDGEAGDPLILTPYIKNGQIDQAKAMSQVNGVGSHKSYSGYFTVDDKWNSNMFFWFFPAQEGGVDDPVLLWLQGGPGGSSMFGLFVENGPLMVDANGQVKERNVTWNKYYHTLYIDNPVGTGFSFTNSSQGLSVNEDQVADNLYNALIQFFTVFSEYQKSPFYITGESYAGKYIPAIGNKIHVSNPTADMKINIVGFALGDALIDPEHIFPGYADLLFNIGMLDASEAEYFRDETAKAINLIQNKQFKDAFDIFDYLMNGDIYKYPTYLYNATGTNNYYNFLLNDAPPEFGYYASFLNSLETRKAIHVGSAKFNDGADVEMALINDIMDSMSDEFVVLLENYKVLIYNGQLDIIVGTPLTENYLQQLKWSGQEKYLNADKRVWRIGTEPVGFIRQVGNFQQIVVRNAGHILPFDQPEVALEMIKNFVNS